MRKFIIKLIIFLIPVIAIVFYFETKLYDIPNWYTKKKGNLEKQISDYKVLALGSSHEMHAINPDFFSYKGYNAANFSQSLYYDYKILFRYLDQMTDLKLVLIPVSYFFLEYNLSDGIEYRLSFMYERYFDIPPENPKHNFDIERFSLITLYGGQKSLEFARDEFNLDLAKDIRENGFFVPEYNQKIALKEINWENGLKRVKLHHSQMDEKNFSKNIYYLQEMIKELKKRGIIPVIITCPAHYTYFQSIDIEKYKLMQEEIKDICKKYNIEYFNYFSDRRFNDNDFIDVDHLNEKGAGKFSEIIDKEIIIKLLPEGLKR